MNTFFGWGFILAAGLFGPVALPAGGGDRQKVEIRRNYSSDFFFAGSGCDLRASPTIFAPTLEQLELGTPVKILRNWQSADGQDWVQIQPAGMAVILGNQSIKRGWINI